LCPTPTHSKCHGLTPHHLRSNNSALSQSISVFTKTISGVIVITMNVGQIILGRLWLFDKNVTIYDRSNIGQFEHEGKQIKLLLLRLKTGQPKQTSTLALLPTPPSPPPLLLLPPYLSPPMHVMFANCFLPYCRHHSTIKHSSLHQHLHHINTCTRFTKRSVMKINGAM